VTDDQEDVLEELREIVGEPDLVETSPREAFDLWMDQQDKAESTLQSYRYRVRPFLEFLAERGIDDLAELTSRDIKEFEAQRRSTGLQPNTINNQFGTLRLFLRYCEELDAVAPDTVAALDVPDLDKYERVNTERLPTERAKTILENLDRYRYASRDHVMFLLMWRTSVRIGTLYALDVDDVFLADDDLDRLQAELTEEGYAPHVIEEILADATVPFLYPRHSEETPLKKQDDGERVINLADWVGDVLEDYIEVNRLDITDDHGRDPLLTTQRGQNRLSGSAMRNWVYILTQPCEFGGECPHDRDPETCEAREHGHGSKCPSSMSPHKVRTGSITHHRDRGWPIEAISQRANTSEDMIRGVYDQPEQLVRGASRRQHLELLEGDR
jgi:site-specific recombinase XerD